MWEKLKNALIKIWFTGEGYKQFQREMQDIKQGTKPIEHQGKEKKKDEKQNHGRLNSRNSNRSGCDIYGMYWGETTDRRCSI